MLDLTHHGRAKLSECGRYRYALWRVWDAGLPSLAWRLLTPSAADAEREDATTRRLRGFCRAWVDEAEEIVFSANDRCDQETVLAQLGGGVRALRGPVDNLESNWAFMVMTALAWNLKAWWALMLPEQPGRYQEKHRAEKRRVLRLEFKTFVNAFVRLPCQIVRGGRKLIYRLLGWNPQQPIFIRLVDVLRC